MTEPTHNPPGEARRASCLRENFTSSSYGEGLETDRKAPRQLLTRQLFFRWIKQHLRLRGFFSNDPNGVRIQVWTAICAYLLVPSRRRKMRSVKACTKFCKSSASPAWRKCL